MIKLQKPKLRGSPPPVPTDAPPVGAGVSSCRAGTVPCASVTPFAELALPANPWVAEEVSELGSFSIIESPESRILTDSEVRGSELQLRHAASAKIYGLQPLKLQGLKAPRPTSFCCRT